MRTSRWTRSRRCTAISTAAGRSTSRTAAASGGRARPRFAHPIGTRSATPGWGERVVATNVCFEPTVGILIRRELLMRSPRFNGDTVTPAVNHVAQLEWEWTRDWTVELMKFVLEDSQHGAANREVIAGW